MALCIVIAAVFIGQTIVGERRWIEEFGAVSANILPFSGLWKTGEGQAVPAWATLFTYMFLHGSWWHVLTNLAVVGTFCANAERVLGTARFLAAYLAMGVLGAFGVAVTSPHSREPAFGASLAYCGVLGAYLALLFSHRRHSTSRAAVVLALEVVSVGAVAGWFVLRSAPTDGECGIVYHALPFMIGWFSVRIWSAVRRVVDSG